jgi:hypothetical protein
VVRAGCATARRGRRRLATMALDQKRARWFGVLYLNHVLRSLQGLATIPEAAWELFLGVYCTIWGFRRAAPILSESAR